jgi:hypothetical protein
MPSTTGIFTSWKPFLGSRFPRVYENEPFSSSVYENGSHVRAGQVVPRVRPVILCEYCHAMGNSVGNLQVSSTLHACLAEEPISR